MKQLNRTSLAEQVSALIRDYIDSSDLQIGDKLNSESSLCDMYQVSRTTIREALRLLQAIEYVRVEPNKGAYVADKNRGEYTSLKSWFLANEDLFSQIYTVRLIVEPEIAALAALNGTQEKKMAIMGYLAVFCEQVKSNNLAGCALYDELFHIAVAKATNNSFLIEIATVIAASLKSYRGHTFTIPSVGPRVIQSHTSIAEAILRCDADEARQQMKTHIGEYDYVVTDLAPDK